MPKVGRKKRISPCKSPIRKKSITKKSSPKRCSPVNSVKCGKKCSPAKKRLNCIEEQIKAIPYTNYYMDITCEQKQSLAELRELICSVKSDYLACQLKVPEFVPNCALLSPACENLKYMPPQFLNCIDELSDLENVLENCKELLSIIWIYENINIVIDFEGMRYQGENLLAVGGQGIIISGFGSEICNTNGKKSNRDQNQEFIIKMAPYSFCQSQVKANTSNTATNTSNTATANTHLSQDMEFGTHFDRDRETTVTKTSANPKNVCEMVEELKTLACVKGIAGIVQPVTPMITFETEDITIYASIFPKYGPTLSQLQKYEKFDFSAEFCSWATKQLVSTLTKIHKRCLVHLDIHPSNILLGPYNQEMQSYEPKLYLIDFGISQKAGEATNNIGTLKYNSPYLKERPVSYKDDFISLIFTMYYLQHQNLPWLETDACTEFESNNEFEVSKKKKAFLEDDVYTAERHLCIFDF